MKFWMEKNWLFNRHSNSSYHFLRILFLNFRWETKEKIKWDIEVNERMKETRIKLKKLLKE